MQAVQASPAPQRVGFRVARSSFFRTCGPAKTEDGLARGDKDLVPLEAERRRVEGRPLGHELPRLLNASPLERHDHRHLLAVVGVLCHEHGEEVGELMEEADSERLDLNGRPVATLEHERGTPIQALPRAPADPDLAQLGVGDAQLDATFATPADKQQALVLDDEPASRRRTRPFAKDDRVADGALSASVPHADKYRLPGGARPSAHNRRRTSGNYGALSRRRRLDRAPRPRCRLPQRPPGLSAHGVWSKPDL